MFLLVSIYSEAFLILINHGKQMIISLNHAETFGNTGDSRQVPKAEGLRVPSSPFFYAQNSA